jgi:hypothetical protein
MNYLKLVAILSIGLLVGCGKKDESTAKTAGSKVGETVADFALGVGNAVDKKMTVKVDISPSLAAMGVSTTIAKWVAPTGSRNERGISVYVITAKPIKGKLVAKALSEANLEIGRATTDVEFTSDDAKYVQFSFGRDMDTQLVVKYTIDFKDLANQRPQGTPEDARSSPTEPATRRP